MKTFRLTVAYDGGAYAGWQVQPGRRTVAGELARACRAVGGRCEGVLGAGRTDAGVHAVGQVVRVRMPRNREAARLPAALNGVLSPDVVVSEALEVADSFDPRRRVIARAYRYAVWNRPTRSPFAARLAWWVAKPLNVRAMRQAAALFRGRHDFSAFCLASARERDPGWPVLRCRLVRRGQLLLLDVVRRGFLHRMVRLIAGAVVAAGAGLLRPGAVRRALAAGTNGVRVAAAAPAHGLCLLSVRYQADPARAGADWPVGVR